MTEPTAFQPDWEDIEEAAPRIELPADPDAAAIARWIRENIAFHLQTGTEAVSTRQPFTEMGLDSIAALTITGDLAEALGRDLPQTLFWDYPTIERISAYLAPGAAEPEEAKPEAPNPWPTVAERCGLDPARYRDLVERTGSWDAPRALPGSLAIAIRGEGRGAPLFWVCDLAGTRPLAESLGRRPVFAVPSGFGTFDHTRENVRALAAYYAEEVRAIQPQGPYFLGGYCYGAKVAMETARLLARAGHEVGGLVMLEWVGPNPWYWRWFTLASGVTAPRTRERLAHHLGEALRRGPGHLAGLAGRMRDRRRLAEARRREQLASLSEEERRLAAPEEGHWEYTPEPYDGRTLLILGDRSRYRTRLFPDMGWRGTLTGDVRQRLVKGGHFSVLQHPHVDAVARVVDRFLGGGAGQ